MNFHLGSVRVTQQSAIDYYRRYSRAGNREIFSSNWLDKRACFPKTSRLKFEQQSCGFEGYKKARSLTEFKTTREKNGTVANVVIFVTSYENSLHLFLCWCECVHIYFFALRQYTHTVCLLYLNFYEVLYTMWWLYDFLWINNRSLQFTFFSSKLKVKIKEPPTNSVDFKSKS